MCETVFRQLENIEPSADRPSGWTDGGVAEGVKGGVS